MKLYPYLADNGLYGYADSEMELRIPARYKSASSFTSTGFAVISDEKRHYGVVDKNGNLVVPPYHKTVRLYVVGEHTLACTNRTYTNSLRFWEWRFWPGFLSPSDKRLFDTKVSRAHLRITVLETGQRIYSERVGEAYNYSFGIELLDDKHFLRDGNLYGLNGRRFSIRAKHVFGQLDNGSLLKQQGDNFYVTDREGKSMEKPRYYHLDSLLYGIEGKQHRKNLVLDDVYHPRIAKVFADEEGKQYVFPDFDKSFPTNVSPRVHDSLAADILIGKASLISSIPGADRFIFRWYNRTSDTFEHWTLDTAGNWHGDIPVENSFSVKTRGTGRILWPRIDTVIPAEAVPQGWRLSDYRKAGTNSPLFEVTIKREEKEERMGVWDGASRQWVWRPEHNYVRCLDAEHGYWTFQPIKKGKYGLYHLPSKRVLIPPTYHDMGGDGMVSYYDKQRQFSRFYVDWDTQREYRDK